LTNKQDRLIELPSVAVVLLNWNGKKFLEQFLPTLLQCTHPGVQIVVADNGSTDDSIAFMKANYPDISILSNPTNEGFAKGYNIALEKVQADIFVLLNSDIEVTPGWIEPIAALMSQNQQIAACQPKILAWSDHKVLNMPVDRAAGLIDMVIHFVAAGFLNVLKQTTDSMIQLSPFFGQVVPPCL
jgi:glycosyltransferase involved in cell wall biosynthesis